MKIIGVTIILVLCLFLIFGMLFVLRLLTPEDSWIKDGRGVWIKHGNPASTPEYVLSQQEVIVCANQLYQEKKLIMNFSSQCLGTCGNYAVDVVHVPRTEEDNEIENQCTQYRERKVSKFIELDKEGEIVRIV